MLALRQRAALLARRVRPTVVVPRNARTYASSHDHDHHDHHHDHGHNVEEPLGAAFYIAVGGIASSFVIYNISRPGPNGEPSSLHKWFSKISDYKDEWETRNTLMAAALEQAAHDKHLLLTAERSRHIELKYPEVFSHGSPFNVPAGFYPNLDHVIEHYRKQHLEEEERKAKKLAAAAAAASEAR